ncbi:MAG: hypothetical protein J6Y49_02330 [Alphaproteobacteria bacterium]|nr:hypothetical protein [Alphaproteobacteria bacterium]
MKKNLLVASAVLLSTGIAFAKPIDFNTVITWNSKVISEALTRAGFLGTSNAAHDVRVTHRDILEELVNQGAFSLSYAMQVCMDKCNLSDFLKNGRGQSGKKCPELCEGFTDALVAVNNEYAQNDGATVNSNELITRFANNTYKVYSPDKQYYAMVYSKNIDAMPKEYVKLCVSESDNTSSYSADVVMFESATKKAIALLKQERLGCAAGTEQLCAADATYDSSDSYGFFRVLYNDCCKGDCSPTSLVVRGKK